ncbi:MAG TPA: NADP(H)-dependent aldo-keto reductase [Candidatus Tenderia sp.]|nr:NADP(H)-dependent aldo-keto reductase [Candidatus Tenderia sp.]
MEYRRLGRTDLNVSSLCLGTMTFGEQNSEADAHAQLDYALAAGINFIDTAEMYPVPPKAETQGLTEQYIGSWLKARGGRDKIVLATKVAGPSFDYIRDGNLRFDRRNIEAALNASLKRLNTDYIDLYQLHWPERKTNYFGQLGYIHHPDDRWTDFAETLSVLDEQIKAGKIRHVGLSNETPWGTMKFLQLAEQEGLPRMASIQNPYSLLNRSFEVGLAEVSHREDIGLLAYSPLGFGVLSGKYLQHPWPADGRITLYERFRRYTSEQAAAATQAYVELARDHDLAPAQMALAFVTCRSFVTSNIIGATNMAQLKQNIDSIDISLSPQVLEGIEAIHQRYTIPCP